MHEQDLIVIRDIEESGEVCFGIVEDLVGGGGAVGDLAETETGIVEVDECLCAGFND